LTAIAFFHTFNTPNNQLILIIMTITCPKCGKTNEDTAYFCSCGHPLKSRQNNTAKPDQKDIDKDKYVREQASNSAVMAGLIIGLLVAFGLGAFLFSIAEGFNIFILLVALLAGAIIYLPVFFIVLFFTQKSIIQSDPQIQEIKMLEKRNDKDAIESLIGALHDKNEYVWYRALKALSLHLNDTTIKEIIDKLVHTQGNWRIVNVIEKLKLKEAVQPLIKFMDYPGKNTIIASNICALGEIGDIAAFQPVLKALGENESLYQCASNNIKKIVTKNQTNDFLFDARTDKNHLNRRLIAELLGDFKDQKAAQNQLVDNQVPDTLMELLLDKHNDVRKEAAKSLRKLGDTRWIKIIKGDYGDFKRLGATKDKNLLKVLLAKLAIKPFDNVNIERMIEVLEPYSEKEAKDEIIRLEKELDRLEKQETERLKCLEEAERKKHEEEAERAKHEKEVASKNRQMSHSGGTIACPNCQTRYNREVVIDLLRQQSPEMFYFGEWSTTFYCKNCRYQIPISGK